MIQAAPGPNDLAYFQTMHADNMNMTAVEMLPYLMNAPLDDPALEEIRSLLNGWDFQSDSDSQAAAVFEAYWKHLILTTLDELPLDLIPAGNSRIGIMFRNISADPNSAWWDQIATPVRETRDETIATAFAAAVADLEERMGIDPAKWTWGGIHQIYFEHQVMTNFPVIKNTFNQGPFPVSGGSSIVNASNWRADNDDYWVDGTSASMRMIVDLSDLTNAVTIIPVGQSGHPGHPHYVDLVDLFRNNEYLPMYWARGDVEKNAEGHLRLRPGK